MFRRKLFIYAHQIVERRFYSVYKKLIENQWKSYGELKEEQEKQLRYMIDFVYKNVPYYHKLLDRLQIKPRDITKIEDLEQLPVLTKEIIKNNWEDFKPIGLSKMKYYEAATGGSTGTPLKYRLSKYDRFIQAALIYRGWGYGNYKIGEKIVFLAGASLDVGKTNLKSRLDEMARNIKKLSSFDMGETEMKQYANIINLLKPKFIRGYASSIYFFAKWLEQNNVKIHQPLSVFTTSEKLYTNMREKIGEVFNCSVYDGYGLNDGGISCYECPEHTGLHIDTERSIMEVVDKEGNQLSNGEGKILATSLYNYAMPFIRYDTDDLGYITEKACSCGRGYKLLKEIVGRQQEMLQTPEGVYIHGELFSHIFWEINGVKEFQVIQEKIDKIVIKIVPEEDFDEKQLDKIREIIRKRSEGWSVEFKFVEKIERLVAGKYKFIINNMDEKSYMGTHE